MIFAAGLTSALVASTPRVLRTSNLLDFALSSRRWMYLQTVEQEFVTGVPL